MPPSTVSAEGATLTSVALWCNMGREAKARAALRASGALPPVEPRRGIPAEALEPMPTPAGKGRYARMDAASILVALSGLLPLGAVSPQLRRQWKRRRF